MKYDEIGEWSEIKLEIIKEYAGAYTKILRKQTWCKGYAYIDAFAGAGWHVRKATGEFVPGSPLNALLVQPSFTEYHYIDLDNERVEALKELTKDKPNVKVYHGDCNEKLVKEIFPNLTYQTYKRALCILDPYGINLEWQTVVYAGKLRTIDILINFPIMDINRNVLFDDLSKVRKEDMERMNLFWGDASWQSVLYQPREDLFGETHQVRIEDFERLAAEYRTRLNAAAGFEFVPEPVLMRNSKNGPLYYLFFASPKPVAQKIITHIFRRTGKGSGRR
jgi:three-Cys-motif partner protein